MSSSDLIALGAVIALSALVIGGALVAKRRAKDPAALSAWILARRWPLALAVSGALMAPLGVGMILHASYSERVEIDLDAAERGAAVDAELATIEGYPRPDAVLCRTTGGSQECFTPVTARPDSTRVAALVPGAITDPTRGRWSGFVSQANPLDFRAGIESTGLEPTDEPFHLLTETRDERAFAGGCVSLAGLALFAVGWVWIRRKAAQA